MRWRKTAYGSTIPEVVMTKSGMSAEELRNPKNINPMEIENLVEAAAIIKDALQRHMPVYIMGDYDVDGVTSTSILWRLFHYYGVDAVLRLPKRISEGYGLSAAAIDEFTAQVW